eukprot:scaffold406_cov57-Cylindrotheca_fusiformis.AAC.1
MNQQHSQIRAGMATSPPTSPSPVAVETSLEEEEENNKALKDGGCRDRYRSRPQGDVSSKILAGVVVFSVGCHYLERGYTKT